VLRATSFASSQHAKQARKNLKPTLKYARKVTHA
jgi:hypothetical protein